MAFRIEKAVVRGEISNDERGLVTGRVWLAGRTEPLLLRLQGNCLRDLAGCRLCFTNPCPEGDPDLSVLAVHQEGVTGEMTASRKIRRPAVTDQEVFALMEKEQEVPSRLANCLYLEWYSEENARVVIETSEFKLEVSPAQWVMSPDEEEEQLLASHQRFQQYIDAITREGGEPIEEEEEPMVPVDTIPELPLEEGAEDGDSAEDGPPGEPLNEFEWEEELRDADRRAEAYQEAFEKYRDHPQRERLIAEALGWDDGEDEPEDIGEVAEEPIEWSEEEEAEPHHPLSQRAMDFALTLQREAEERGLMGDHAELRESPVLALILHIISLGGKLAGALDGWAQGLDPEPGFIIAMLKRAQVPLNEALHAFDCIDTASLTEETRGWLQARKRDLFELRREIIDLMQQLRAN